MNTTERTSLMNTLQRWIRKVPPGKVQLHLVDALAILMREQATEAASAAAAAESEGK